MKSVFRPSDHIPSTAETSAALEAQYEKLNAEHKQERFFCIFVIVALVNALVGSLAPWYVETIFLTFSIIGLIGCLGKDNMS